MNPGLDKFMMRLRMESKEEENRGKPLLTSTDVVRTADFMFSKPLEHDGDSGSLRLATRKTDRAERYLVKRACTDCACNDFVYTKLAQAMGYSMPDAVLFQLSPDEKRPYFKTEYIIGERYLNVLSDDLSYEEIREQAKNWEQYFPFYGMYAMTGESDGVEILLADDHKIYRVDATDAFPLSMWQLDTAGINREINGTNPYDLTKRKLLSSDFTDALNYSWCNIHLDSCLKADTSCKPLFLEPFTRIQEIPDDYIDDFLNTLCYFYPDFIGDYFKLYLSALQKQCAEYLEEKR